MCNNKKLVKYGEIQWLNCTEKVLKLQRKIILGYKRNNINLVYKLQESLVNSFEARAIAVRKVSTNNGSETPGVDGKIFTSDEDKLNMIFELKKLNNYKSKPLRRILISKNDGSKRPLGIPTIKDRCVQALYTLALQPIAESTGDNHSYGFRIKRSTQDVMTLIDNILKKNKNTDYVLNCDIKGFFDNINHDWILNNIPINKRILKEWLKSGAINSDCFEETQSGVPQGGIISPIIANMVLDGLEKKINIAKIIFIRYIRYADNILLIGNNIEDLKKIKLEIIAFLKERNLELNPIKTQIFETKEGFDFLGFNFKKIGHKLFKRKIIHITPTKKSLKRLKGKIKVIINKSPTFKAIVDLLNPVLRGWGNYYSHCNVQRIFARNIDNYVWWRVFKWICKKFKENLKDARKRFIHRQHMSYTIDNKEYKIFRMYSIKYVKHNIINNSYNPYFDDYFTKGEFNVILYNNIKANLYKIQKGLCPVCKRLLKEKESELKIHYRLALSRGGTKELNNQLLLDSICYNSVIKTRDKKLLSDYRKRGIIIFNNWKNY